MTPCLTMRPLAVSCSPRILKSFSSSPRSIRALRKRQMVVESGVSCSNGNPAKRLKEMRSARASSMPWSLKSQQRCSNSTLYIDRAGYARVPRASLLRRSFFFKSFSMGRQSTTRSTSSRKVLAFFNWETAKSRNPPALRSKRLDTISLHPYRFCHYKQLLSIVKAFQARFCGASAS